MDRFKHLTSGKPESIRCANVCKLSAYAVCQSGPAATSLLDELINANAGHSDRAHRCARCPCLRRSLGPAVERRGDDRRGVFDEVVLPEGLVASLGEENLREYLRLLQAPQALFSSASPSMPFWIESGCSGCGVG